MPWHLINLQTHGSITATGLGSYFIVAEAAV